MVNDIPEKYHTEAGRLASFQTAQPLSKRRTSNATSRAPKSLKWPHAWLAPEKLAEAGFFFYPSQEDPDNVTCFLCGASMCGWEKGDDPFVEHLKLSPDCGWAIVASVEAKSGGLHLENPMSSRMVEARRATFGDRWPHEGKKGWKCKVKQLVEAGWIYKPTPDYDDFASCPYCTLALDGWEPADKPFHEHHARSSDCAFFTLSQETVQSPVAKKTVKGRKPRASKASRLSTQSQFTADQPSIVDLEAEEGDSAMTTATNATMASQPGRKIAKGKKATTAKGRKTRARTEEPVEIVAAPEPEDDDFQVKVEQPKPKRGKKRVSDEMDHAGSAIDTQEPPAKRRTTRARGSMAIENTIEAYHEPELIAAPEEATSELPVAKKRGRPSTNKGKRIVSNASKAPLRAHVPDEEEIDKMLEEDLARPLSEDEEFVVPPKPAGRKRASAQASAAPVRKATRGSKVSTADHAMFATEAMEVDDAALEAELEKMEFEESRPLPKARNANISKPRKPSAKQQAAAKRAAEAEAAALAAAQEAETAQEGPVDEPVHVPAAKSGRKVCQSSQPTTTRRTRASMLSNDASMVSAKSHLDESTVNAHEESGNESDATVVRGGAMRRGSALNKMKSSKKAASRNIEEIVQHQVIIPEPEVAPVEEPKPKRATKSKKAAAVQEPAVEEPKIEVEPEIEIPPAQETRPLPPPPKATKPKATKIKGKGKATAKPSLESQPEIPAETPTAASLQEDIHALLAPSSPVQPPKELTPSPSPQSSDAENRPPSSIPSALHSTSRIPLAASTPTTSPSKRNVVAGLQSMHPWSAVDLDEVFAASPRKGANGDQENAGMGGLEEALRRAQKGQLTSPERSMSVEEWVAWNAGVAEEKLRGECERMVGVFEREGGRAMRALEGVVTID